MGVSNLQIFTRVLSAVLLSGLIGTEREYKNRPAGMRTHVLVCLGATMIALLECMLNFGLSDFNTGFTTLSLGRLSAQVISGIGFLGAGTIFIAQKKIEGLTTAASLWNVACMGLLIGYGYIALAAISCFLMLIVLTMLQKIIRVNAVKNVEIEYLDKQDTLEMLGKYFTDNKIKVLDVDFHVDITVDAKGKSRNLYSNIYKLHFPQKFKYSDMVEFLMKSPNIRRIRTRNI